MLSNEDKYRSFSFIFQALNTELLNKIDYMSVLQEFHRFSKHNFRRVRFTVNSFTRIHRPIYIKKHLIA